MQTSYITNKMSSELSQSEYNEYPCKNIKTELKLLLVLHDIGGCVGLCRLVSINTIL